VTLSLLGILSAVLFGGFRFGLRAWEAADKHMEATDRVEQAQSLLRGLLAQAHPAAGGTAPATFIGGPTDLEFVAPLPAHRGRGGLYRFKLGVVAGDASDRLVLDWRPYDEDARAGAPADKAVLLSDVDSLQLGFFGSERAGGLRRWQDRWTSPDRIPELVRLRVEQTDGSPAGWPELTVSLQLAPTGG
jgi:general secretion pathway protein J